MKPNLIKFFALIIFSSIVLLSCSNDDEGTNPSYSVPETYTFDNVKYTGQTVRILLVDSLGKLINKAKTQKVTKDQLLALYNNTGSLFGGSQKLSDKTAPGTEAQILSWFDLVEMNSPMINPSSKDWFITPEGLDISQLVQKTLMGSVLYYQATSTYLAGIETDENETVKDGEGTTMEHHWDEAFGYYSAPIDFGIYTADDILKKYRDTNGNGKQDLPVEKYYFHSNYSVTRDEATKNFPTADQTSYRKTFMDNFLKGRAAISNKDYKKRDEAKKAILEAWEKQIAANAIKYFNDVKKRIAANSQELVDIHSKQHEWAEGRGFLNSLKYNNSKIITDTQWEEISNWIGNNPSVPTIETLNQATEKLRNIYKFSEHQRDNF